MNFPDIILNLLTSKESVSVSLRILSVFIGCGVILAIVAFIAGFSTYVERKISAFIQNRIGPNRVGPYGLLQFVADGIKLISKEDIIPKYGDSVLFRLAPYLVFTGAFCMYAVIPLGYALHMTQINVGLLYILGVAGLVVIGILMGGWGSGNKWSVFGAMRSAAQMISYEIPEGVVFLTVILITGTMQLDEIVNLQSGGIHRWIIFRYFPFTGFLFLIYYITALAETNRTPFDIPEAESELIAGYHTEYSGMRFAFFFLAEYASMLATSGIATTLFLGGWCSPIGETILGGFILKGTKVGEIMKFFESLFWFFSKSLFLVLVMMWLRWTLPRYRVDQLMGLAWKVLLPMSLLLLFSVSVIKLID
ncbi:MAG: NADH-quinone oxidoreductase subunit NuoH [Planctomycetota bacterium]